MVPHFAFVPVEHGLNRGTGAVEFGFGKAKDVGSNGIHVEEGVEDIGPVIVCLEAIDVLEVYANDMGLPGIGWSMVWRLVVG